MNAPIQMFKGIYIKIGTIVISRSICTIYTNLLLLFDFAAEITSIIWNICKGRGELDSKYPNQKILQGCLNLAE